MNSGLKSQQVYDDTSNIVAMPMDYQVKKVHMTSSATIRRLKLTATIGSKACEVSNKANQVNRPDGHLTEARQYPLGAPDERWTNDSCGSLADHDTKDRLGEKAAQSVSSRHVADMAADLSS